MISMSFDEAKEILTLTVDDKSIDIGYTKENFNILKESYLAQFKLKEQGLI